MVAAKRRRATAVLATLPDPNELISVRNGARHCDLGESTLWRLVRKGEIPSRRIGRRVLIRRGDLDAYVDSLPDAFEA